MKYQYTPQGTCSRSMEIDIEDGLIKDITVLGGCSGNLQGIRALVIGQRPEQVIARLSGIRCGSKPTSCPDQLAQALRLAID